MAWGQIAAAAIGAGASLLGKGGNAEMDSSIGLGSTASGNVTDIRPPIEREALMFPLSAPKSKGFMSGANNFLGTQTGGIVKDIAGSFLGDYRQRRNSKNRFADLKDEGLTPQEIAGSSGGGAVQAQGNTLGSGPMVQAQTQRDFQADQAQKDRDLKKYVVDKQTDIPQEIEQSKLMIHRIMSVKQFKVIELTAEKIGIENKQKELELNSFWQILVSRMSEANVKIAAAMFVHGIDAETMLKVLEPRDPETIGRLRSMWRDLHDKDSWIYKEFHGLLSTAGKNILGPIDNAITGSKPRGLR